MSHRTVIPFAAFLAMTFAGVALQRPTVPEPTAYTVITQFHITGTAVRTTMRLGSKVLVDVVGGNVAADKTSQATRTRTFYDLETQKSLSWKPGTPSAQCRQSSFKDDEWLDPFAGGKDLAMKDVTQHGSEKIRGIPTVILESKSKPGFRLWVDPKTGLMMKAQFTSKELGTGITYFEVTDVSLKPPPASLFEIPAICKLSGDKARE